MTREKILSLTLLGPAHWLRGQEQQVYWDATSSLSSWPTIGEQEMNVSLCPFSLLSFFFLFFSSLFYSSRIYCIWRRRVKANSPPLTFSTCSDFVLLQVTTQVIHLHTRWWNFIISEMDPMILFYIYFLFLLLLLLYVFTLSTVLSVFVLCFLFYC